MRILLASSHRYPAYGDTGSGFHPRRYPSGSGYHLHDLLAQGLAEQGHEIFYFLEQGAEAPMPPLVKQVSELISDVDVCHAPLGPPAFAAMFIKFAKEHGIPCLLTCHMKEDRQPAASNWVFVSRALAQVHGSHRVVLNGINPNDLIFSRIKQDYMLFMGAMNKAMEKGLDLALSLAQQKGTRLIVAGTALDYKTIAQVSDLCAANGAEYLGDVRGLRKAELLAGARALLFPSRLSEGCPLVVLEAMFSGTPVIASPSGGTVEIVTPEAGFICHEKQDWFDALDRLPAISSARCREIAMQKYQYGRMAADYVNEYKQEIQNFKG